MNKQVSLDEGSIIYSLRLHNYYRVDTQFGWGVLSPGRTIWESPPPEEIDTLIRDITDGLVE